MFPVIAQWGSFTLYSYGLSIAAAFLVAIFWATRRAKKAGLPAFPFFEIGIYGGMACILGSRLLFVLEEWPYFLQHPHQILRIWDGGLVFYGGYIAAMASTLLILRLLRLPLWKSFDIYAPALPLGMAIGRLGCFLNGCCYGLVSHSWGLSFPSAHKPPVFLQQLREGLIQAGSPGTLPVIPTQLISAAADAAMMLVLLRLERKPRFPGFLFWNFVLIYSMVRGVIEFFRYHDPEEMILLSPPFSLSQMISIALIGVSLLMLRRSSGERTRRHVVNGNTGQGQTLH